jgi:hypothetical protein
MFSTKGAAYHCAVGL